VFHINYEKENLHDEKNEFQPIFEHQKKPVLQTPKLTTNDTLLCFKIFKIFFPVLRFKNKYSIQ
jgi:hypothetical protein